ncbi:MAG: metal ABC transporter permease [Lachnospiraceae bacterium]
MNEIIDKLQFYMEYPFVRYALIVGTLIALCSSLLGVTLVLKRYSYIGDGLSHVAFGAMAIAAILNMTNDTLLIMPVTIIAAVWLLRKGQNTKVKGDAAIAMMSVSALALGYLLLNLFSTSANVSGDVCSTLFGSTSILTLTKSEVWLCIILAVVVIVIFILFYNRIFSVTFDEEFMKATGMNADDYNFLIAIVISVIIVLGMNLVGSLLISALVIFPALSAMRIVENFKGVVIVSALISVCAAMIGILISILFSTPVGSTIVAIDACVFGIFTIIGKYVKR